MEQIEKTQIVDDFKEIPLIYEDNERIFLENKQGKKTMEKDNRNLFFVQLAICSIIIVGALYLKYIETNPIFKENIKKELMQTVALQDVKQFVYELTEVSNKYWRIK